MKRFGEKQRTNRKIDIDSLFVTETNIVKNKKIITNILCSQLIPGVKHSNGTVKRSLVLPEVSSC